MCASAGVSSGQVQPPLSMHCQSDTLSACCTSSQHWAGPTLELELEQYSKLSTCGPCSQGCWCKHAYLMQHQLPTYHHAITVCAQCAFAGCRVLACRCSAPTASATCFTPPHLLHLLSRHAALQHSSRQACGQPADLVVHQCQQGGHHHHQA